MKEGIVRFLRCIQCDGDLALFEAERGESEEIKSGKLRCKACSKEYPISNFIPRFVPLANYSASFGFQFRRHSRTQLDSVSGHKICHTRFFLETGFDYDLSGERVLEVGCGAGRFTEVALDTGADVFSVDLSGTVDVCLENHGLHPRLHLFQANVYDMPFRREFFDKVFCIGVLQHTPDPRKTVVVMKEHLKQGGRLAFNVYPLTFLHYFIPKYWLRPITKRMSQERLYRTVCWLIPKIFATAMRIRQMHIPFLDRYLGLFVPDNSKIALTPQEQLDWAILCVFDMLSPAYDKPRTLKIVRRWMSECEFKDIFMHPGIVARGTR